MNGEQRFPRSIVTVNGVPLQFISWEVNNNGYYQADTFHLVIPLTQTTQPKIDAAWWSQRRGLSVSIYDGLVKDPRNVSIANFNIRIMGIADTIEINPIQKTVRITGRDYAAAMIDTKIQLANPNSTASDVAIAAAKICGLKANVTKTKAAVGTYYQIDSVKIIEKSAWDAVCELAHLEKFVVSVSGQTLNFSPPPSESSARILTLDDSQRITTGPAPVLSFVHSNLKAVNGVVVRVRSWDHKTKKRVEKFARLERKADEFSQLKGAPILYSYQIANLKPQACQDRANAYLAAISKHEASFTADDMPGDPALDPFQPIKWNYAGTQFEQVYFLDSITRSYDFDNGYRMSLRGKNRVFDSILKEGQFPSAGVQS